MSAAAVTTTTPGAPNSSNSNRQRILDDVPWRRGGLPTRLPCPFSCGALRQVPQRCAGGCATRRCAQCQGEFWISCCSKLQPALRVQGHDPGCTVPVADQQWSGPAKNHDGGDEDEDVAASDAISLSSLASPPSPASRHESSDASDDSVVSDEASDHDTSSSSSSDASDASDDSDDALDASDADEEDQDDEDDDMSVAAAGATGLVDDAAAEEDASDAASDMSL